MGQFSWIAQDTKRQIFCDHPKYPVHMVDPRTGEDYFEQDYEGYGVFGGRDFYEFFADLNKDYIRNNTEDQYKKDFDDLYNIPWHELTNDQVDTKRMDGIDLWFSIVDCDESFPTEELEKQDKETRAREIKHLICPILVEDYNKWCMYRGTFPEQDRYQGWHMEDDEESEDDY